MAKDMSILALKSFNLNNIYDWETMGVFSIKRNDEVTLYITLETDAGGQITFPLGVEDAGYLYEKFMEHFGFSRYWKANVSDPIKKDLKNLWKELKG